MGITMAVHKTRRPWSTSALVGVSLAALTLLLAGFAPVHNRVGSNRIDRECQYRLKRLAGGVAIYSEDYDERLPLMQNWAAALQPYVKNRQVCRCPDLDFVSASPADTGWNYAYNSALSGIALSAISEPTKCVEFFDSSTSRFSPEDYREEVEELRKSLANRGDGPDRLLTNNADPLRSFAARHRGRGNAAFVGGTIRSAASFAPTQLPQSVGDPPAAAETAHRADPSTAPVPRTDLLAEDRYKGEIGGTASIAYHDGRIVSASAAGLTSTSPFFRGVMKDGTVVARRTGVRAKDDNGGVWVSCKILLDGKSVIAFLPVTP